MTDDTSTYTTEHEEQENLFVSGGLSAAEMGERVAGLIRNGVEMVVIRKNEGED